MRTLRTKVCGCLCVMVVLSCLAVAQQGGSGSAKMELTGRYEGTAKNKAGDVITLTIDVAEKEGTLSGTIDSSHGKFAITGGSRKGDAVTIEFDVGGPVGTISAQMSGGKLVGTWTAGDDGGDVDVKRVVAQEGGGKGKA